MLKCNTVHGILTVFFEKTVLLQKFEVSTFSTVCTVLNLPIFVDLLHAAFASTCTKANRIKGTSIRDAPGNSITIWAMAAYHDIIRVGTVSACQRTGTGFFGPGLFGGVTTGRLAYANSPSGGVCCINAILCKSGCN